MLKLASETKYENMKIKNSKKYGKSPFEAIEAVLHDHIKDHRKKGRKVSEHFMRAHARKITKDALPEKADAFKAIKGWFHQFLRRKGTKFRKRKSGKKAAGKDNMHKSIEASQIPSFIWKNILASHCCAVLCIFVS